jgi:restriction system protein
MARRRKPKDKSIFEIALNSGWKFSASFATVILIATFLIPSLISNPYLQPMLKGLRPLGLMVAGIFYLIAVFRYISSFSTSDKLELAVRKDSFVDQHSTYEPPVNVNPYSRQHEVKPTDVKPLMWSLKLIQELEWKRFEELCVAYYNEKGIKAETTKLGADGGIDIKLYQDESGKPTTIVQCKAWTSLVGVKQIREFLGVMTHEKISKGFYMTTSGYTEEAKDTAKSNNVTLINGDMLIMMISRLTKESQDKLLSLATEGDYKTPSCSSCGTKMIRRSGKGKEFWGCANFPRCRHTLKLRAIDIN